MNPNTHRWVVVTGAAQGVGLATSRSLLRAGYRLMAVDSDGPILESKILQLSAEFGPDRMLFVAGDVSVEATARDVATQLNGKACAGLVNNAACMARGQLDQITPDSFQRIMGINCFGPLSMLRALRPNLSAQSGRVINIGSTNAYGGESDLLEYSMSKAALACATRNLAPSLAKQGIRICQVNLGWVLTENEKVRKVQDGWEENWFQTPDPLRAPYGRLLSPEEVGDFIVMLFSECCSLLNGSILDYAQNAVGMSAQP